jgi:hypothetical protein
VDSVKVVVLTCDTLELEIVVEEARAVDCAAEEEVVVCKGVEAPDPGPEPGAC